jgi:hypothetical protein
MSDTEQVTIGEQVEIPKINNSKELFYQLIHRNPKLPLPTIEELPVDLSLPRSISNIFLENLKKTLEIKREFETFVYVENGQIFEKSFKGGKTNSPIMAPWVNALAQNTSAIFLHSHPDFLGQSVKTESTPSSSDFYSFKTLNRLAYVYGIVNSNDSTLIVQTIDSYNYSVSKIISTAIGASFIEDRYIKLFAHHSKSVAKTHGIEDWQSIGSSVFRSEVFDRVVDDALPIFTEVGYGYYRFKGDIRTRAGNEIEFKKLN